MASFPELIGGSGRGASTQADCERSINWYVENIESRTGKTKATRILRSKPGLSALCVLPNAPSIAALCAANGRVFAVAGGNLYELSALGGAQLRGAVGEATTQQNTLLCPSQNQLLVVSSGNGFIFDLTANTLSPITAEGWIPGTIATSFLDAYFIILEPNSQTFAISGLNDGTSWDPLDFGSAEGEQGNIVGMIALQRQLWLMANTHGEVYYDSGNANFPFSRLEGAFCEQGLIATASLQQFDNTIVWLGGNRDGAGIVWRANGYQPERISTHAMETTIQQYASISDAIGYTYQEDGHTFYHLSFPSANNGRGWTWCYDVASGEWHERGYWNAAQGLYYDDLARVHCFGFGEHLVGDWRSGTIYVQSSEFSTDNGALIRRERIAPALTNELGKFFFHSELRVACEVGIGQAGSSSAAQTPVYVQSASQSWQESTPPQTNELAFASANTGGNVIVATILYSTVAGGAFSSITDSQGNHYQLLLSSLVAFGNNNNTPVLVYAAYGIKGGANTVSVAFTGGGGCGVALTIAEYHGLGIASAAIAQQWPNTTHANPMTLPALAVPAGSLVFLLVGDTTLGDGTSYSTSPAANQRQYAAFTYQVGIVLRAGGTHTWDATFASAGNPAFTFAATGGLNGYAMAAAIVFAYSSGTPGEVGPQIPYQDPQLILVASDDGGKTWSAERPQSMGPAGEYSTVTRWHQLGRSNNRAYKLICSEPNPVAIVGADLDAERETRS